MRSSRRSDATSARRSSLAALAVIALAMTGVAGAEVKEVKIARGFAIPHLPIMIMEHEKLLEKHALAAGLGEVKVVYSQIGGGSVMNDALISGALSFGVGGPPPMLTLWDKTRSGIQVKGVCAEATMPLFSQHPQSQPQERPRSVRKGQDRRWRRESLHSGGAVANGCS